LDPNGQPGRAIATATNAASAAQVGTWRMDLSQRWTTVDDPPRPDGRGSRVRPRAATVLRRYPSPRLRHARPPVGGHAPFTTGGRARRETRCGWPFAPARSGAGTPTGTPTPDRSMPLRDANASTSRPGSDPL